MNNDHLITEEFMRMEAVKLVAAMVASSPSNVKFTVGSKLNDYRRIFRSVIEDRRLILLGDTSDMISFAYCHDRPCEITYLQPL